MKGVWRWISLHYYMNRDVVCDAIIEAYATGPLSSHSYQAWYSPIWANNKMTSWQE
jgi:hypothetical protein